jgi:predicted ATPase
MSGRIGHQLGHYHLQRLLGKGAFAEVYLGEHIYLRSQAAIKVLQTQVDSDACEGFLREARYVSRLIHPHIIRVLDFGMQDMTPFLVMEYAPYGTLRERHPKGSPVALATVISYVTAIASALDYIHQCGLIHRDLKPENLLLGQEQQILLCDFGIALLAESIETLPVPELFGTLAYMAPEQIRGQPCSHSDQYALAVMVYEWLSGDRPFHGNVVELSYQQVCAKPASLYAKDPSISRTVEYIVFKALSKDPTQRFPNVRSFATALAEASRASIPRQELYPASALETAGQTLPTAKHFQEGLQYLPAPLTPLIGREQEAQAVCSQLLRSEIRLLTLTGTGGIGKTRVALDSANHLLEAFPHGVRFVPLGAITHPDQVIPAIAQALGLLETRELPLIQQVIGVLHDKQMLLLLDNFEQVLSAAPMLTDLLAACPGLKMLVTSRAVLHVQGECELPLLPLPLPDLEHLPAREKLAQYASIALFVQRVQAIKPDFRLTEDNARILAEICVRLEGLPLALELAAARTRLLSLPLLLSRLKHRFSILTGGRQDAPLRQQTLRNTISWSYDLLSAEEQRVFQWLAVFGEGCTLEAAETICAAPAAITSPILDIIAQLVDKSLLHQQEQATDMPRLFMLETIREYALERLEVADERECIQEAHAVYYQVLVEQAEPQLFSGQQRLWLNRLTQDYENIRASLTCFQRRQEWGKLTALAGSLGWYWYMRGRLHEAQHWLELVLREDLPYALSHAHCKVLAISALVMASHGQEDLAIMRCQQCLALSKQFARELVGMSVVIASGVLVHLLLAQGKVEAAQTQAEETVEYVQEPAPYPLRVLALINLGSVALYLGDYTRAREIYDQGALLSAAIGDQYLYGEQLIQIADACLVQSNEVEARRFLEQASASYKEAGVPWQMGWLLSCFAHIALQRGDGPRARFLMEESLVCHQQLADQHGMARAYALLAQIAASECDYRTAQARALQCLQVSRVVDDHQALAICLEKLADVVIKQGATLWAIRLYGVAERLRETTGVYLSEAEQISRQSLIEHGRRQLGEQAFANGWIEGRRMTLEQSLAAQGESIPSAL